MLRILLLLFIIGLASPVHGQNLDTLQRSVVELQKETRDINLRMKAANKQFQTGILVSTLGYSITIAGGLMLGRENDSLGQALLVVGGATGATGTYILVDSFNVLSGKRRKKKFKDR